MLDFAVKLLMNQNPNNINTTITAPMVTVMFDLELQEI